MILKDLLIKLFKKDEILEQEYPRIFEDGITFVALDSEELKETKIVDKDGFEKIKENAKKDIEIGIKNTISKFTENGFELIDDRVVNGVKIADEFVVMEKDNAKFIILDQIYSCSNNTATIEGICLECSHFESCKYHK